MVRLNVELAQKDSEKVENSVVVAIDKDKGSHYALKWAVDHFLHKGQSVTLLHVSVNKASQNHFRFGMGSNHDNADSNDGVPKTLARDLFLPFRCFCTRKFIKCQEIVVEDSDIPKALVDYVSTHVVETLILGTPTRGGMIIRKFRTTDVPSSVAKSAPEFCNVYVINKEKLSYVRSATAPLPVKPSPSPQKPRKDTPPRYRRSPSPRAGERLPFGTNSNGFHADAEMIKSSFTRRKISTSKPYEPYRPDKDISFVSNGRPSSIDHFFSSTSESLDASTTSWQTSSTTSWQTSSTDCDHRSSGSMNSSRTSIDIASHYLGSSQESGNFSCHSHNLEDVESEMRRLKLELKQTMDLYNVACNETLAAKQKTKDYLRWKLEGQHKFEEARVAEEAALVQVEKEKAKSKPAIEAAQAAQRLAELEAQKWRGLETKSCTECEETRKVNESQAPADLRYRRYTIEEIKAATNDFSDHLKIGEGGYGPVYKCYLDHTEVAVKILRADASQGMSQFHQEVEVLSCIRHPNMVLLLGACPEYGCLVYEYMANGSLDDRIFRRGNTPPIPWQVRFRIAAEIATGLLFLHQTKPEPLVHRDLKPENILLDYNFVSKISDVGLARLVPPSVADSVTRYRMTSAAGTFCYIDPEYQQTGMLGTKSDIYSLGVLLLQIITAKSPMGLTYKVECAIEDGTFAQVLDPTVLNWPVEETLCFAKLALQCTELRRKDRPDLRKVILPELNRLREFGEENMSFHTFGGTFGTTSSPIFSQIFSCQEAMTDIFSAPNSSNVSSSSSH